MSQKRIWSARALLSFVLLTALLLTLAGASLAWLMDMTRPAPKEEFSASSIAAYFAGGDGSSGDPYLITEPVHLYNLAWLQYLGIFNEVDAEGNILHQYYFRLENDVIIAEGEELILPPIGTPAYPFVGNFNGNGKMISGITVSNYLVATQGDGGIEQAPASVKEKQDIQIGEVTEGSAIIGFFGVVGNWDGSIKGLAVESADQTDVTQKVNAVYNFFLDDLTVRSDTAESLMGLLAGYVTGSVENVGIGSSSLELGTDVGALNVAGIGMQALVSEYSLIGLYDPDLVNWTDKPTGGEGPDGPSTAPGGGGGIEGGGGGDGTDGDGAAWGGSIDMLELNRRLTYIIGAHETITNNQTPTISASYFDFAGQVTKNNFYTVSSSVVYFAKGTYMPLNVDADTMFNLDENGKVEEVAGNNNSKTTSYYLGDKNTVWRCAVCGMEYIGNSYSTSSTCSGSAGASHSAQALKKAEKVSSQNTGYFVGGGATASGDIRSRPYNMTSGTSAIFRAFGKSQKDNSPAVYDKKAFQLLTIDVYGNTYVIDDDDNTVQTSVYNSGTYPQGMTFAGAKICSATDTTRWLQKYYEQNANGEEIGVKSKLNALLSGQTLFHGVRFYQGVNTASLVTTKFTASILGKTMQNYEAICGTLNFTVKTPGYITAVAATNASSNVTHTLFSLFSVKRDENNEIIPEETFKINTIHEVKNDATGKITYEYNWDVSKNQSGYTYTLVYNEAVQNKLVERYAVYYFEIPVGAGDFAIGSLTSEKYGAYLMYLDIAANGNATDDGNQGPNQGGQFPGGSGGEGGDGEDTVPVHTISGVNFVDEALLKSENRDISTYPTVTLSVTVNDAEHDPITVAYNRESAESMTYQIGGGGAGSCAVSPLVSTGVAVSTSTSLISVQLWALPPPTKEEQLFYCRI